ncbi:MAG TPA: lysylphosphatidylglycerol synthase transmembrane domain-containing protein [Devosiaceae bacterium]|nr:lysylphosphatidylglycerol synthase transmembrane domain-containing protein [Devosiaceae bacterium]
MHQKLARFNVFRPLGNRRMAFRALLALLVTAALVFVLFSAPWAELGPALMHADPLWIGVAVAANIAVYPLWVVQWRVLAHPHRDVPKTAMTEIVALSSVANTTLFKALGLASSLMLLVARGGLTPIAASSLLAIDQLLVGLVKAAILLAAVLLLPVPEPVAAGAGGFAVLVAGCAVALLIVARRPELLDGLARARTAWAARLGGILMRFALGLHALRSPLQGISVLLLAFAKKLCEIVAAYAVQRACGIEASPSAALLSVAAVGITTAVPLVPGSLGVYSATAFAVYTFLGIAAGPALAAGLLQHVVEIVPSLAFGYGVLVASRFARAPQPVELGE